MPELAISYLIGFLLTAGLAFFLGLRVQMKFNSRPVKFLQLNLAKRQLFWSESQGKIQELTERSLETEKSLLLKSSVLTGVFFSFLSWFGFVFLLILNWSLQKVGQSRTEITLFESEICQKELDLLQIEEILKIALPTQ